MIRVKTFRHYSFFDTSSEKQLERFINEHHITREQIIAITAAKDETAEKVCLVYEETEE